MLSPNEQLYKILTQLSPLTAEEIALANFSFKQYKAKELIFSVNHIPKKIYYILEGIGRYYFVDANGKEINKSLVNVGCAFASISSLVSNTPSPLNTQALTNITVAAVDYQTVIKLAEEHKNWATFIRRSYEYLTIEKEQREMSLLMLSAKERYQEFLQQFGDESQLFPLNQVAMYLGITDVSLSRLRKELGLT